MPSEHQRLTSTDRADLVAYLDGELPEQRCRTMAEKLTRSLSARREVESLEATWELLELLPRPSIDEEFSRRTLTLAVEARGPEERLVRVVRGAFGRALGLLACLAAVAGGLVAGDVATRWLWPDRTARLARDLTIAERLDDYEAIGSLEFLRRLEESTLFEEASD